MTPQEAYIMAIRPWYSHLLEPDQAYKKALEAGKRLPKIEYVILSDPWYSYLYSRSIIRHRWEEAEDIIMTDTECSSLYAEWVIGGKLPEKMHNMMILYAIKDTSNKYVKEYFEFIK